MIRLLLFFLVLLTGCTKEVEEITSAALKPAEIQIVELDVPARVETIDYAQMNTGFSSVFTHQFDDLNVHFSNQLKQEKADMENKDKLQQEELEELRKWSVRYHLKKIFNR